MVNGPTSIFVERAGKIFPVDAALQRRRAPAAHHRQDRRPGRPPHRRGQPAGRRPPARRLPRQRRHPADRPRRLDADHPQVLAGPVHRPGPARPSAPSRRRSATSSRPACAAAATSSSPAAPAPGRRRRSTSCRATSPTDERIVTIEDAAELQLHQEHVLRLESRPANIEGRGQVAIRDLVKNALRMRPDRIVVGEVRDGAALDMLQAMNTGHDGSITTVHANSPRDSAVPARDHGADGRHRAAGPRHPRAGRQRDRPRSSSRPGSRTAAGASSRSPRWWGWRGTSSPSRTCSRSTTRPVATRPAGSAAASSAPVCAPSSPQALHDQGIDLPTSMFVRGLG